MNLQRFDELPLSAAALQAIATAGFTVPTAVQAGAIPVFLTGKDVIVQAQTGTGKTAAFALPILEMLTPRPGVVEALVLTPTRELALQVSDEFNRFGAARGFNSTALYGGTSFTKQYEALETAQIVVATPGRLLDLMRRKKISLASVRFFGLDESDEMLSMGFERDVLDVAAVLPAVRQSFLCSATYSDDVKRVAGNFIRDPEIVDVSSDQIGAQSVKHIIFPTEEADKLAALHRLVSSEASTGALIFANTRAATFRAFESLAADGHEVDVLNGELSQTEREVALERMKSDKVRFLVCTDVAARGIDISGLPAVINFDMPESPDVYIHRTGRTGRAGQAGVAYSFVTPADISVHHALDKFYKLELNPATLPSATELRRLKADSAIRTTLADLDSSNSLAYGEQIPLARRLLERPDGIRVVAKLIAAFARSESATVTNGHAHDFVRTTPAPRAEVAAEQPGNRNTEGNLAAAAAMSQGAEARRERAPKPRLPDVAPAAQPAASAPAPKPTPPPRREAQAKPVAAEPAVKADSAPSDAAETPAFETIEAYVAHVFASTGTDGTSIGDRAFAWMCANPNRAERGWREGSVVATAIGESNEELQDILKSDDRFEPSRQFAGNWRLRRPPPSVGAEAREPRPAQRPRDNKQPRPKPAPRETATTTAAPSAADAAPKSPQARNTNPKPAPEKAAPPRGRDDARPPARRKDRSGGRGDRDRRSARPQLSPEEVMVPAPEVPEYVRLKCSIGSDKISDLADFRNHLAVSAGLDADDFGNIDLMKDQCTVSVRTAYWADVVDALRNLPYHGHALKLQRART